MKNENRKKIDSTSCVFAYFRSAKHDVFYRRKIAVYFFIIVRENVNSNAAARVASLFKNVRIFNTFIVLNIHSHSKIIVILLSKQQLRRENRKTSQPGQCCARQECDILSAGVSVFSERQKQVSQPTQAAKTFS